MQNQYRIDGNNVSPITGQFPVVVVLYLLTLTPIPWTVLDLIVTLSHSHTHTQIKAEGHWTALHFWAGTPRRRAEAVFFFTHYSLLTTCSHYLQTFFTFTYLKVP